MIPKKKRLVRIIAVFLLLNILQQIIAPLATYALTAGPTAPEATSFEPIDTTDMVNLQSGDFNYNIPLLEVPGPEGGYPLSLSYHAGIQPNEEASWTGLGWTVNTGAINRTVNGYADDHQNMNHVVHDFWKGGARTTYSLGTTVGIGQTPASVSFNLSVSRDTYLGSGLGFSMGLGGKFGWKNIGGNVGVKAGWDPLGDFSTSANARLGAAVPIGSAARSSGALSGGLNASTNFKSISYSGSVGLSDAYGNSVGANISSTGVTVSANVGGFEGRVNNQNYGKTSTTGSGFTIPIPVAWGTIDVGYDYERYWSDEKDEILTNGTLYYPSSSVDFDKNAFDTYSIADIDSSMTKNLSAENVMGGSFPDYDNFYVASQGVSGSMRPYWFRKKLVRQNKKNGDTYLLKQYNYQTQTSPEWNTYQKTGFRFDNDFSNKFLYEGGTFVNSSQTSAPLSEVYSSTSPETGLYNTNSTSRQINKLPGSKNIEWYTNQEILNGTAKVNGFIDTQALNFTRSTSNSNLIGGFSITNESGVTYHYALPAYSYEEEIYSETVKRSEYNGIGPEAYNDLKKPNAYAYTWFLTAITGPDYVDKDNNGLVSGNDWGYWIRFDYGKWKSDYAWRNPSEGFAMDVDNQFQNYSQGKKELYYLNAVVSRSHVAVFEKSERLDGRDANFISNASLTGTTLRLDKIHLINAKDYDPLLYGRGNTDFVIDGKDIATDSQFKNKTLRTLVFGYDYSLCPGVSNFYSSTGIPSGKLTLKSLKTLGKQGADLIPSTIFDYDIPAVEKRTATVSVTSITKVDAFTTRGTLRVLSGDQFLPGDIIAFNGYHAVIFTGSSGNYSIQFLKTAPTTIGGTSVASTTKNAPYNFMYYDSWGMYKPDYISLDNENLSRAVTNVSALAVDVWSLRNITTATGATISVNYESDSYNMPVLARKSILRIKSIKPLADNQMRVTFWETDKMSELLKLGGSYGALVYAAYKANDDNFFCNVDLSDDNSYEVDCSNNNVFPSSHIPMLKKTQGMVLTELGADYAVFKDGAFYDDLTKTQNLLAKPLPTEGNCGNRPLERPCMYISSAFPEDIYGGFLLSPTKTETKGGGIRVTAIQLKIGDLKKSTTYDYTGMNSLTSGVTSFEPFRVVEPKIQLPAGFYHIAASNSEAISIYGRELRNNLWDSYSNMLMIARELPAPGVMYEYVTVGESVLQPGSQTAFEIPGKVKYQVEVFKEDMVRRKIITDDKFNLINNNVQGIKLEDGDHVKMRKLALEDYSSRIGSIKRVIYYDKQGQKLTETINNYLYDDINDKTSAYKDALAGFNNQGIIQENFTDAHFAKQSYGKYDLLGTMTRREFYPNIPTGSTTINYKTGVKAQTQNLAFDFYSGELTRSVSTDGYGNRFMSVSVPAYTVYPQMGLKVYDPAHPEITNPGLNKHMLTQNAASYMYKVDANNEPIGVVSASAQTWSNSVNIVNQSTQNDVWRKKATYVFVPQGSDASGITPNSQFTTFDFTNPEISTLWRKTGEITLYDIYSNALEARDINNNVSATKLGYNQTLAIASGSMANYNEIAFSGAEDQEIDGYFGGGVLARLTGTDASAVTAVSTVAHTGSKSLQVNGQQSGFVYSSAIEEMKLQSGRKYVARVWVRNAIQNDQATLPTNARLYYKINGETHLSDAPVITKQANGWYTLTILIPVNGTGTLEVGCLNNGTTPLYFDDFRFQPMDGGLATYVYDPFTGELTHILDNNNMFTRYEYDGIGRLIRTYRETFQYSVAKTSEIRYNYARPQ
ncbi:hypothetical protein [Xanthocytophaga agilis]|uniref:Type IV secretion protein Rhs n=1 Tax=Xanthocytophaga agilis TaxID=3048010 RepID=A0AAE3QZX8_9BACT|nr:hypothetical protein [Xanthocytophaga agilis]MDJ1501164.1 hypothetical protein [Xanthocytophaga agilis]